MGRLKDDDALRLTASDLRRQPDEKAAGPTDLPVRLVIPLDESRLVIPAIWHHLQRGCWLRAGALNEDVHEKPRLCGPIAGAARAGDPVDGTQHVHRIDIRAKISASDGAAR
jgi:hypothetical protein